MQTKQTASETLSPLARQSAKPRKVREVKSFTCTESVKVHGVLFECKGTHRARSTAHRAVTDDSTGTLNVWIEWNSAWRKVAKS